jgi:hypothetical protein
VLVRARPSIRHSTIRARAGSPIAEAISDTGLSRTGILEPMTLRAQLRFNELGHALLLVSVIAFSGQADTQRPQERQASTFGVYATCMP